MIEAFKLGYAVGMGIIASAITGLIILGVWDWLGGSSPGSGSSGITGTKIGGRRCEVY